MSYPCPVCGYGMEEPPANHNICPCCGTEFGYHDSGRTFDELRSVWIERGARWWSPADSQPYGWNPLTQLLQAGLNFRLTDQASRTTHTRTVVIYEVRPWKAA